MPTRTDQQTIGATPNHYRWNPVIESANRGSIVINTDEAQFLPGAGVYYDPVINHGYNIAPGGLEVIANDGLMGYQQEGHFVSGGTTPDMALALSGNVVETEISVTRTSGAGVFVSGDVGLSISYQTGFALITSFVSATEVTATVRRAFPSTALTAGTWVKGNLVMETFILASQGTQSEAGAVDLTLSATTGSITVTAASSKFVRGDIGRSILHGAGGVNGAAIITGYTSDLVVTALVYATFTTTAVLAANWTLAHGQARPFFTWYNKAARSVESVDFSPGVGKKLNIYFQNFVGQAYVSSYEFSENLFKFRPSPLKAPSDMIFDLGSAVGFQSRLRFSCNGVDLSSRIPYQMTCAPSGNDVFMNIYMQSLVTSGTKTGMLALRASDTAGDNSIFLTLGRNAGVKTALATFEGTNIPSGLPVHDIVSGRSGHATTLERVWRVTSRDSAAVDRVTAVDQGGRMLFADGTASTINPATDTVAFFWNETSKAFQYRDDTGTVRTITAA